MKDESQWIKIPDHHTAIISKELFAQVQAQRPRIKSPKKSSRIYTLRGKVFCGCCRHAMPRRERNNPIFFCRYTKVNDVAACHGLVIGETELETMLYEVLNKQAQIILNLDDLSQAGSLSLQIAKQNECGNQVENCLDQKQKLYEQFLLQEISLEDYKKQSAAVDVELDRLKQIQFVLTAQTTQMQMGEKAKSTRAKLAQEVTSASGLTAGLADALIDRVYVYPGNQLEIFWKMKDFCMEGM